MNCVNLIGRLTKDPELKYTSGNGVAVVRFTLAVDRTFKNANGEKEADFIPIVFWKKTAENIGNYMHKGSLISVRGKIQTRTYDAADGTKRYVTEVIGEESQFLDKKDAGASNNSNNNSNSNSNNNYNNSATGNNENYMDDVTPVDDGDIPF